MPTTEPLTETQWQTAHAIAQTLVKEQVRIDEKSDGIVTELKKTITYLRASVNQTDAESRFFKYLKTLVSNGKQVGHSGRTPDYYRSIDKACCQYLQDDKADAYTILQILGWASRLMRYYKEAGPIGEITAPTVPTVESLRQTEIAKVAQSQDFKTDQFLDAKVTKINGNKVTYEILGVIKLTEKEPKKARCLQEGQIVQVKITALKEDGSIKSVKYVD